MAGGSRPEKWERQDGEPLVAYSHFVSYRNTPASDRSLRKLAVSPERAFRLSRKHRWVARAAAYDAWLLALGDETAKHAVLRHRAQLVRLGSALLDKATEANKALRVTKSSANDVALLARAGVHVGEAAFGPLNQGQAEPSQSPLVAINLNNNEIPGWLSESEAKPNQRVLVPIENKVLAEQNAALPQTGHAKAERLLPGGQAGNKGEKPKRQTLKEAMIKAPVRRNDE